MKASDRFTVGDRVVIGYRFLGTWAQDLCGRRGMAVRVGDPSGPNKVYPHGLVEVELDPGVRWPSRIVCIGPEDLAPMPAWAERQPTAG
ncbi:MAG TPA: hypothetical protein VIV12_22970 [Streptosporangiaceae bacterium]